MVALLFVNLYFLWTHPRLLFSSRCLSMAHHWPLLEIRNIDNWSNSRPNSILSHYQIKNAKTKTNRISIKQHANHFPFRQKSILSFVMLERSTVVGGFGPESRPCITCWKVLPEHSTVDGCTFIGLLLLRVILNQNKHNTGVDNNIIINCSTESKLESSSNCSHLNKYQTREPQQGLNWSWVVPQSCIS